MHRKRTCLLSKIRIGIMQVICCIAVQWRATRFGRVEADINYSDCLLI